MVLELETSELVLRAQGGDRSAFGELVRRYSPSVQAVALEKLRDLGEAQELTHEAFVRALTKLHQLREPAAFVGWVRQIALRLALNRLTRRRRAAQVEDEVLTNTSAATPTPLDALLRAETRASVRAGLAHLNAMDRATLVAFYVQGQSIREMADAFATPEGTIKRRLHVARQRLKTVLEGGQARTPRRELAMAV